MQTENATRIEAVWKAFFGDVFRICFSVTASGTTANRPVTNLWVGKTYFDTTLGLPIWYDGTNWIDGAGNIV